MTFVRWSAMLSALVLLFGSLPARSGEPLVVKTNDGKFVPAAASEWGKAGEHSIRFVLKAGAKASDIAAQLKDKIAPIAVKAPDDFTVVFESPDLTEAGLLEKLAGLPLSAGADQGKADAVAALAGLGEGGPALTDLSSAGSIRASKKIDLPASVADKGDPQVVTGTVVKVCDCGPIPSVVIKVLASPKEGPNKSDFKAGKTVSVRGYYKQKDNSTDADPTDERTRINLASRDLKPGDKVFGKPLQKDGEEWVLETVQKL